MCFYIYIDFDPFSFAIRYTFVVGTKFKKCEQLLSCIIMNVRLLLLCQPKQNRYRYTLYRVQHVQHTYYAGNALKAAALEKNMDKYF